jgi:hypothetical protein
MWPAMLLMWLPSLLMRQQMTALSAQMAVRDYSSLRELWPLLMLFYVVAFVLILVQVIGIAQLALGRHKGPVWFYFELGKPVWKLIGSLLLLIAALFIGWLAVVLADLLVGFLMRLLVGSFGHGILAAILGFLAFVVMLVPPCALFYCAIRLTFLLVPVVAAEEEGFALARSWTLGLRNFWRMFVILLATLGPFIVLEFALVFGFLFKGIAFPPLHATGPQTGAYQAAVHARTQEMMGSMYHYWYISFPLTIVFVVLFYGLCTGAQCFAYRSLTDGEASGPVAAD